MFTKLCAYLLPVLAVGTLQAAAQKADSAASSGTTFTRDVLPILQENCQDCHRAAGTNIMGMVAPMSLTTFQETRPWAKAIAREVKDRRMPPWHADEAFNGIFANERRLEQHEIDTILRWVDTGAHRGNPADAPAPRTFPNNNGWKIAEPDLVVKFEEPYFVADYVRDQYADIYTSISKKMLPEDRWIKEMEFRPGSDVVHHIVIYTDTYRPSVLSHGQGMLGGMGAGTDPSVFPDGYGRLLESGSQMMFNMHYHKEPGPGTGVYDSSAVAFTFQDKPIQYEVVWGAVGTQNFAIPPRADNHKVTASQTLHQDTILLALFPHTHLRGKGSKYVAYYPNGKQEILLHVPNYDFNWQTNYIFKKPKRLPKGTRIEVTMWYDNSEARAELAGFNPNRTVYYGEPTTDEMMFGWIDYTSARPRSGRTD